jgi:alpha-galactosidase
MLEAMTFKLAIIGAGSVEFTRTIVSDLLTVPEFADIEVALTDINADNLEGARALLAGMVEANGLPTRITASLDRREALRDARYVANCCRIGGLDAFALDIEIPLRYGVDQCVGDTICAGGLLYGQRNVPAILDFCADIRDVAEPGVLFLNYANPMAINTWAANVHGGVNTVGLCHGVQHGASQIANVLGVPRERLDYICSGINHQTWYVDVRVDGRRVTSDELLAAFRRHPEYSRTEKVRIDVLERFGVYSTESNGHLSEYLPWYRKRPDEISRWIDTSSWINGETGGYLRQSRESHDWFATDYEAFAAAARAPLESYRRSQEHFSYILEAIETGRVYRGHFNVPNDGVVKNLPSDAVVESTGFVDRFGINMVAGIELPVGCATTCSASIAVQRMAVEAAVKGDLDLLKLAVLHDPLVGAVCDPDEVWRMVDEMVVAQARWLPQYADAIPAARERVAAAGPPPRATAGTARREARSVEELRTAASLRAG